ncbi:MAG TPA: hypothetical protein VJR48_06020, partial [Ktedonobacterales bacterium]|nr:hypothetical protein [Ktedonobacterales bacterium]
MSAMRHAMTLMITTESLAFGAFVVDDSHQIISWNEVAAHTLGFDSEMTLGRTCEEMLALLHTQDVPVCPDLTGSVASDDNSDARRPTEAPLLDPHALRQLGDSPMRIRVVTQHGEPRWLDMSIAHARKLDGSACIVHIFR